MNTQPLITDSAKLSILVNPERIRSSVKRLFRNNISESLSEVFQNSQRAGATHIAIVINAEGFSIHDDGHGKGPPEDRRSLLEARSSYQEALVSSVGRVRRLLHPRPTTNRMATCHTRTSLRLL